jgi:hypothetical protein
MFCSSSCQCARHTGRNARHSHARSYKASPTYAAWANARRAGRPYVIAPRWHRFENFLADMGAKPGRDWMLARRDKDGAFDPQNCYWAKRPQRRDRR